MNRTCRLRVFGVLAASIFSANGQNVFGNVAPVAEAGLPRYAAQAPVRLDGSTSYDPDHSGQLRYAWTQVSGPALTIVEPGTPTPTISGFVQTDQLQSCTFQLVVGDGELTSLPDTIELTVVPSFGATTLRQENPPFDPNKPTVIYFGGGNCYSGSIDLLWLDWYDFANVISFPNGYVQDASMSHSWHTYYHYGDMIVVYLSSVAPEYHQLIQTIGWSTGGQPALDVGIRLNRTYQDPRYCVNHVTELDAPCRWRYQGIDVYASSNALYQASAVDGEQCWHDHYWGDAYLTNVMSQGVPKDLLCVYLPGYSHGLARDWYKNSLGHAPANRFNSGVVAGAYWSVAGPGKNLQLTKEDVGHFFRWNISSESMTLASEAARPGRLLEPVTLAAWAHRSEASGRIEGAVLSCRESENAVCYQLLFGSDPHRVAHYRIISDTPIPPTEIISDFPPGETWWTVRVRDQYGSTIYADPIRLDLMSLPFPSVENARTGRKYGLIGHAILDAQVGDVILVGPATYDENIKFAEKTVTVRSVDPDNPVVVAGTIIRGQEGAPAVTFSGRQSAGCVLAGLTIESKAVGVSCRDAVPTIRNCVVRSPEGIALEFWWDCVPTLSGCTLLGQVKEGGDLGLVAYWKLDESWGVMAAENVGTNGGTLIGNPTWQPAGGKLGGALQFDGKDDSLTTGFVLDPAQGPFSVFAWVKGGAPSQVIVSQASGANWLRAASPSGALATELNEIGRNANKNLLSSALITDSAWHRVGLVWDGKNRILCVDGIEVAKDGPSNLRSSTMGLRIGAGNTLAPGTFWSGLIDDVRIYNRAVKP